MEIAENSHSFLSKIPWKQFTKEKINTKLIWRNFLRWEWISIISSAAAVWQMKNFVKSPICNFSIYSKTITFTKFLPKKSLLSRKFAKNAWETQCGLLRNFVSLWKIFRENENEKLSKLEWQDLILWYEIFDSQKYFAYEKCS